MFVTKHSQFYILWNGDSAEPVNHYSITSADDAPKKDPKSWNLSASNDNETWVILDKQEDQHFDKRQETKEYIFENKTSYKYYKLNIESNGGDASTQIAEWCMQVIWTDFDELMQYSSAHTKSDLTPMGRFFENRHVTTEEDLIWLNDAKEDAPLPDGDSRFLETSDIHLYPSEYPMPTDAIQHGFDNCAAVAVFASMAYSYPRFVKSIIKENEDKTYTVSMFDPQGKAIKVSVNSRLLAKRDGQILGVSGKFNIPSWASILEKALIKYNHIYKISRNYDLGRIGIEHVIPLFTGDGNSFAFAKGALNAKDLARVVKVCLKQDKFVLGGFGVGGFPVDGSKTVASHVYSFMLSKDTQTLFSMRNPWGSNPEASRKTEGMLSIVDDGMLPLTIDIRIVEPGIAANFEAFAP